jgi:hypothetical protein
VYKLFSRVVRYVRGGDKFAFKSFWRDAILGKQQESILEENLELYTGLTTEDPEELTDVKLTSPTHDEGDSTAQWANHVHRHRHHFSGVHRSSLSTHSDETLRDATLQTDRLTPKPPFLQRLGSITFAVLERFLVLGGFAQLLSGIVVYTGGCRGNYINVCLAHLISKSFSHNFLSAVLQRFYRGWHLLGLRPLDFRTVPRLLL